MFDFCFQSFNSIFNPLHNFVHPVGLNILSAVHTIAS